jgi:hypothetical protein
MQGLSPVSVAHTAASQPIENWSFQAASFWIGTLNNAVFQLAFGVYLACKIKSKKQSNLHG